MDGGKARTDKRTPGWTKVRLEMMQELQCGDKAKTDRRTPGWAEVKAYRAGRGEDRTNRSTEIWTLVRISICY